MSLRHASLLPTLLVILYLRRRHACSRGPPYPLFVDQKVDRLHRFGLDRSGCWRRGVFCDSQRTALAAPGGPAGSDRRATGERPFARSVLPGRTGKLAGADPISRRRCSSTRRSFGECACDWRARTGNAETIATVEATPPGYGRWDLLLYLVPFLAVGIVWGDRHGAQD